jgi:SAM-dependent methyltransferase
MRHIDVVRDAAKALLPFQPTLRRLKRRIRPYRDDPGNSRFALQQGLQQIRLLREAGIALHGDILEFGTGWLPIIPILYQLAGARRLFLTDVERLMDSHTIALAAAVVRDNAAIVAAGLGLTDAELHDGLRRPLAATYLVPWRPEETASGSMDIIMSRTVLEHVPLRSLERLVSEWGRILRPAGAMCHTIDNSDHWQHRDRTLSRVNFLRYEDGDLFWRLACAHPQNYQNRLRHSDYLDLFGRARWTALRAEGDVDAQALDDIMKIPLAAPFRGRSAQDLATLTSRLVLRRATAQEHIGGAHASHGTVS